jgi:class 3 adenylate cyclase
MDAARRSATATVLPTGIVTLLFTDIERSTRLVQSLETTWHQSSSGTTNMRNTIHQAGGLALSTESDSFFAVFITPSDAVLAAVEAQPAFSSNTGRERGLTR